MKQNKIQKIKHLTSNEQLKKCKNNIIIIHLTGCNPPIYFACPKLGHIS
jgi:hypothetical protein